MLATKQLTGAKTKPEALSGLEEVIDQVGALDKEISQVKAQLKELEGRKSDMMESLEDLGIGTHLGYSFGLEVKGPSASTVLTDMEGVVLALEGVQEGLALKLAKFNLTDLRKYLSPVELGKFSKTVHEGNLKYRFFAR